MLWLLFLHKKPLYQCPHTLHSYLLHLQLASLTTLRKIVPLPISSICHSAIHCLIFLHDTYYFSIIYRSLLPQLFVSITRMSIRVWNTCSLLYPLHMEQYLTHSRYSIKVMLLNFNIFVHNEYFVNNCEVRGKREMCIWKVWESQWEVFNWLAFFVRTQFFLYSDMFKFLEHSISHIGNFILRVVYCVI